MATKTRFPDILRQHEQVIADDWFNDLNNNSRQRMLLKPDNLRAQTSEFLRNLAEALQSDQPNDIDAPPWARVRELLGSISRNASIEGFSPSETATFVLSLKKPLFTVLRKQLASADDLADEIWASNELLDKLGLFTTEVYQKGREEVIARQQQEMLELSTPVVKLWDGILALPLIGTLDSSRTQIVMEALLQRIVETGCSVAIIDITGVPTVDTLVAQHLLKAVTAARLMGADCIISGIRPQIAQTIVHLGVTLSNVATKATLADAFQLALQRIAPKAGSRLSLEGRA
ncbi:MAG: STAS domain-containing protein [Verrucomicrobiota bacterium]